METIKRKDGYRYREKIYINGKAKKSPYFRRKSDAKTWKQSQIQERDKLKALGIDYIPDITLDEYFVLFLRNRSNMARRTIDTYKSCYKLYFSRLFAHVNIKHLKLHHVEELKHSMFEQCLSVTTVNKALNLFKNILNDAVRTGYLLHSPLQNLQLIKQQKRVLTYWLPNEINQFLSRNINDWHYSVYLTAINTGLRKGELIGLCWDCVDFENNQLIVKRSVDRYGLKDNTKSNKVRYIPMSKAVRQELEKLSRSKLSMKFVFTNKKGKQLDYGHFTFREFNKAIKTANVKKIRFHDLRTSFASNYCMQGGDIFTLSIILGHSSVQMTQDKYAHLHPSFMQKNANLINFSGGVEPQTALKICE